MSWWALGFKGHQKNVGLWKNISVWARLKHTDEGSKHRRALKVTWNGWMECFSMFSGIYIEAMGHWFRQKCPFQIPILAAGTLQSASAQIWPPSMSIWQPHNPRNWNFSINEDAMMSFDILILPSGEDSEKAGAKSFSRYSEQQAGWLWLWDVQTPLWASQGPLSS